MNHQVKIEQETIAARVRGLDWAALGHTLLEKGFCVTDTILDKDDCVRLRARYGEEGLYRSHIHMARHGFGLGEYKYFRYDLPGVVQAIRTAAYTPLAAVANEWASRLAVPGRFPDTLTDYLALCHADGQTRPTPLMLKYEAGDYNCLHQDLYGDRYFPFQMAILLSEPEEGFTGGDFMLVENRPRMQSVGHVAKLQMGQAVIFAVNERPRQGSRGYHRVKLRHGVSEILTGDRYTLGIIFHDAK